MAIRDLMVSINFATNFKTLETVDNKVSDLSADLNKMGNVGDKAFSDISRSTVNTSRKMSDLGRSSQNFTESLSKYLDSAIKKIDTFGDKVQGVGKKMTKSITAPIAGAVTAAGGLTTALGFKRLIGMDNAQAKLKGLGYEGKQLEEIMNNARNAVQGTTFATADGAYVAAGALAAGIKEGAELERYIKLVGDAAIGAEAPIEEMAQIFNRVASEGKLTRNELEMINYRLPGFSNAMMEHVGASSTDAFNEMLRSGKVSTDDLLDVMENFAGGTAEAYANTWSGLKDNILANIGIIGEALLQGLFEDGKKGLADFLDILRSDELRTWAKNTGETIREMVHNFIDTLRDLKAFWDGLAPPIQNVIKNVVLFGGIALTVLGPLMSILGPAIKGVATAMKILNVAFLKSPIGLVVLAIVGLIGVLVWAYNEFEWFRNVVNTVWEYIKTSTLIAWEFIKNIVQAGMDFIKGLFEVVWPIISGVVEVAWGLIQFVVDSGISIITGLIDVGMSILEGNWSAAWDAIKGIAEEIWHNIEEFFRNIDLFEIGKNIIQGLIDGIGSMVGAVWDAVKSIGTTIIDGFNNLFQTASPSRLMIGLGEDIGEGLQIGLDDSALMVARSARDLANSANPSSQYTPERDGAGMSSRGAVVYNFNPQTIIEVTGNMTREQEREIETNWKRTIKKWHDEFHREIAIREV